MTSNHGLSRMSFALKGQTRSTDFPSLNWQLEHSTKARDRATRRDKFPYPFKIEYNKTRTISTKMGWHESTFYPRPAYAVESYRIERVGTFECGHIHMLIQIRSIKQQVLDVVKEAIFIKNEGWNFSGLLGIAKSITTAITNYRLRSVGL